MQFKKLKNIQIDMYKFFLKYNTINTNVKSEYK